MINLVVFAGAGVSMGEPACLPKFQTFSKDNCARNRQRPCIAGDPIDHFLGRLQHEGVKVHERAAEVLSEMLWNLRNCIGICCYSILIQNKFASLLPTLIFCLSKQQRNYATTSLRCLAHRRYPWETDLRVSSTSMVQLTLLMNMA